MGTISLSLPVAGTVVTAGLHSTNYTIIQNLANGGIDNNNFASGKIFDPTKIMQSGATTNQVLAWNGSNWAAATGAGAPTYATTLPGSPTDGQEVVLVDSTTNPTYQWRFRFNNGSANTDKWECVGGTPLYAEVTTAETTSSASYAALATAGPTVTTPRAGVYVVEHGFRVSTTAGAVTIVMSYDIGGTGAVDADGIITTGNAVGFGGMSRRRVKSGIAASTALTSKYKTTAGPIGFADRWISILPVRVS
jgi:hypothetical protein